MTPSCKTTRLYLKSIGYIFTIAFLSYYVQYPALSSVSGIEPSESIFKQSFPQLYYIIEKGYCDADSFVELINIFGVILSIIIASGVIQHGILFLVITAIYHFLVVLGSSMYTFQWDILLVEAGFLTAVCFAPWTTLNLRYEQTVGSWPIRFLLFKLMLMSGVVKIQADCPTWMNLTALEYHFATQCLPGPLAWYVHQLHPLLLRAGVAATFVIEIPATFLLLSPTVTIRRVGAWLQVILQLLIIMTGSYNFFNLLTMALCPPCMISDGCDSKKNEGSLTRILWNRLQIAMCTIFICWSCKNMFAIDYVQDSLHSEREVISLKLSMTKDDCNELIESTISIVVVCTLIFTAMSGVRCIIQNKRTKRLSICSCIHTIVCCSCIVITAVPLFDLTPNLARSSFLELSPSTWRSIQRNSRTVSHGYGLFRRMTGVGQPTTHDVGWAGLPPSVVARPEIIFEALIDDSSEWRELKFRWKPGDIGNLPLQAAPHQPRLDWRMWFAALGSINHNPWLVSFTNKILDGCGIVINLLEEPDIASGKSKIKRVRASLYHYDFTRLDTEWSRRLTNTKRVEMNNFIPEQVWTRELVGQYLPELEPNNTSVLEFLQHTGYRSQVCVDHKDRCRDDGDTILCNVAVFFRRTLTKPTWILPLTAILSCLILDYYSRWLSGHSTPKKLKTE